MPRTPEIVTIPCRADNYAFLVHDPASGHVVLIDAPEAAPITAELDARGWRLADILVTHHHDDHVAGLPGLRAGARVIGAAADAHRLPPLDLAVRPGDTIACGPFGVQVIGAPGHTLGHVAYHIPQAGAVFTGDSLMSLGCGRLFEGTAADMADTLARLAALPPETLVCSGHEYTLGNARFALDVDPDNVALKARAVRAQAQRDAGAPTVPVALSEELATNPFLRTDDARIRAALGLADAPPVAVLAELRARKDRF
ncbi:MAG: hydroxyacylglutathione hydrolase [Rubellimicrobium sp.]|nr:hydroxyacylglutathione hydrolase [Rubellimicrobium sp.]